MEVPVITRKRRAYVKVVVGGSILATVLVCALLAPILAPQDPVRQSLKDSLVPPLSREAGGPVYVLGADNLGRDVLSRVLFGSRISVAVGLVTVTVAALIGCTLGAIAGFYGGYADYVLSKIAEMFLALPFLLLGIAVMAFMGASLLNLILVLVVRQWVQYFRVVRAEVMSLKEREFVTAARAIGARPARIIFRHILPNCMASVIVIGTFAMATVILSEASLSFLGLGVPPSIPTWGSMLAEGRSYMYRAWWLTFVPGMAIFVTVLGINLLGDGLRDRWDPKLRNGG
ncbi:MAG: ABC transporter permease [Bacillota bacterium]